MKKIGFAIIGAGNIGRVHTQAVAVLPEAQLQVICNRGEAAGKSLAEAYGADYASDFRQAVQHDKVEVVCVCTPSGTHAEIAEAAAQAGKHVIIEKPIEITLERVDRIIEAVQQAKVKLTCIFPMRFRLGIQQAKMALTAGRLGRLTLADASVKWYRPQSYYQGSWRGTWALDGGGALMNQSIHTIDLLQYLAGPVETIFGRTATLAHSIEAEDTASAVIAFQNGALGVIQGATSCWPGDRARLELHGDRGTIVLEEGQITTWNLADAQPGETEQMLNLEQSFGSGAADPRGIGYELHRRQIADFIQAVREDRSPLVDGAEARKSVAIILAIYESVRTGNRINL